MPSGCKLKRSFDSDDFYETDFRNYDSSTVPVSRSINNLTLTVYVYYNVVDTKYVTNHLQPILKACVTIVPDTRFIFKPQSEKYVKLSPDSFYNLALTNSSTLISSFNNTSVLLLDSNSGSTDSSSSGLLKSQQPVNSIIANVLVISDNFYGYKPMTDSFVSLRMKSNALNGSSAGTSISSSNSNFTHKKSYMLNADNCFKNSFKIYTNLEETLDSQVYSELTNKQDAQSVDNSLFSTNKAFSMNQRLMKRLNEPTSNKSICSTDNKVSDHIKNDMLSSTANNEKLQFKLEKYLQNTCLKSNKFPNNNFSYVDYSKR